MIKTRFKVVNFIMQLTGLRSHRVKRNNRGEVLWIEITSKM